MSDTAPTSSLHPFEFLVAETEAGVVVDEPDRLHERIDGHRAEELEPATFAFHVVEAVEDIGKNAASPCDYGLLLSA